MNLNVLEFIISLLQSDILLYLASGYVFMKIYNFYIGDDPCKKISVIDNLVKSIIIGFVLSIPYRMILPNLSGNLLYLKMLFFIIISGLMGYGLGRLFISRNFSLFLIKNTGISRLPLPSTNFWAEAIGRDGNQVWVLAVLESGEEIIGTIIKAEEFNRYPYLLLANYSITSEDGKVLEDYGDYTEENEVKAYMLDTAKCKMIRFSYHKDSEVIQREYRNKSNAKLK